MSSILEKITKPNDIRKLQPEEYPVLAEEIRQFLIEHVSQTGGHLASNLGVVELTIALHLLLDFPKDKVIWDVGHQCYVHKILTGRAGQFDTLRQLGGLGGFPKRAESNTDLLDTGHSSNSISAACGLVKARELSDGKEKIVAVIGDGALTGGLAFEGLNNAGQLKSNLLIVLNDNKMSISENVGGMARYLGKIRTGKKYNDLKWDVSKALEKIPGIGKGLVKKIRKSKDLLKQLVIPGMLFEEMNITYIGPIDGHNIAQLYEAFHSASRKEGAVLVHVLTKKGKGYECAEHNPSRFHGVDAFDIETGKSLKGKAQPTYTEVFSTAMVELGTTYRNLTAITAAMPLGTGLSLFQEKFPRRCFDVGIAEEHAVSFAAGLAVGGYHPVVAIYSTFLQRAYDQILHDVCLNRLPVTFAIDRAGIVGSDGPTHQGIYDLSFLSHIPGLLVMAPKNGAELKQMLEFSINYPGPSAIRYPRGAAYDGLTEYAAPIEAGKAEWLTTEEATAARVVLLAVGSMVQVAWEAAESLRQRGIAVEVVNVRFVAPVDEQLLARLSEYSLVVTLEENVVRGGFGEQVSDYLLRQRTKAEFLNISLPDAFIEQGTQAELREKYGLDIPGVIVKIEEVCKAKGIC
ncbi:MAG: 1-deoxy-D-xylulose-5-phosphate synthase [Lachnospiraceae bacterium]|nr:1-deoxy-D-xylulose-5-phosphate synthase [Lachnospiraceae bacterium]